MREMSEKHTATPWRLEPAECGYIWSVCNNENQYIRVEAKNPADPEFIVRACNSHEALVKALSELHALVLGECPSLLDEDSGGTARLDIEIRAALEKAKAA